MVEVDNDGGKRRCTQRQPGPLDGLHLLQLKSWTTVRINEPLQDSGLVTVVRDEENQEASTTVRLCSVIQQ